ncbi:MAG: hypothetical protein JJT77_02840 [Crocinitomicaceae bacterium]|nr:hypothetical protein [Crocinitomicaceae bacterium]
MKQLSILFIFILSSLLIGCGNVAESDTIPQCKDIKSTPECQTCCVANGWDNGSFLLTEDVCECRNMK